MIAWKSIHTIYLEFEMENTVAIVPVDGRLHTHSGFFEKGLKM